MRKLLILILLATSLAGCASKSLLSAYGNFAKGAAPTSETIMATDVTTKLVSLYPPAQTRMTLQQKATDRFGASLVAGLRTHGYAMEEYKAGPPAASPGPVSDVALAYVVDQPLGAGLYRVTVHVNSQSLSRLYEAKGGVTAPAGYWVWKE